MEFTLGCRDEAYATPDIMAFTTLMKRNWSARGCSARPKRVCSCTTRGRVFFLLLLLGEGWRRELELMWVDDNVMGVF